MENRELADQLVYRAPRPIAARQNVLCRPAPLAAGCVALVLSAFLLNSARAAQPLWSDDFRSLDNWDVTGVLPSKGLPPPAGPKWRLEGGWLRPVAFPKRNEDDPDVACVALAKWQLPADCTVRCTVRRQPGQGMYGVVVRAKDARNCLLLRITTLENIDLVQLADGQERTLASVHGYLPPGENSVEVRAYGPRVTAVLNGQTVLSCDKAPQAAGRCGLVAASLGRLAFGRVSAWAEIPPVVNIPPKVLKTAYLLWVTRDTARILWETLTPMEGQVRFGPLPERLTQTAKHERASLMHDVTLRGLKPGTEYFFAASSGGLPAGEGSFTTDPGFGASFRIGVVADSHRAEMTKPLADLLMACKPQLVIHLGDYVDNGAVADEWAMDFFHPAADLLRTVPCYVASGNHDAGGPYWSRRYFPYPAAAGQTARYFAFQYGSAYFIVLTHYDTPLSPGSPQHDWLLGQLDSPGWRAARWRFVYYHQPAYSVGWKDWTSGGDLDIRRYVLPLLEKHGTTMVLSGHTHSHERGYLNGVVHIVNGSMGSGEDFGRNYPFVQYFNIVPHYSVMDVSDDALKFTCYGLGNTVLDRFTLEHGKPFDLPFGPTVVKGPADGPAGRQQVVLKCPELGTALVRYRVVLDERRAEDGFWAPSAETFPANQEARLTVDFPAAGKYTVKCQVLTADMLRPGKWVDAGVVNITPAKK